MGKKSLKEDRKRFEPMTILLARGYPDDDLTIHKVGKPGSLSTRVGDFVDAYDRAIRAAELRGYSEALDDESHSNKVVRKLLKKQKKELFKPGSE